MKVSFATQPGGTTSACKQRQQHVAAAEDQRGGAVEAVHQPERLRRPGSGEDRERDQQREEEGEQQDREAPVHGDAERRVTVALGRPKDAGQPSRRARLRR